MSVRLTFEKYYRLLIANKEGVIDNITAVAIITGQTDEYWKQSTDRALFNSLVESLNNFATSVGSNKPDMIMGVAMPDDLGFCACGVYEDAKQVAKKIHESDGFDKLMYYPEMIAGYIQWRQDGNYDSLLAKEVERKLWKQDANDIVWMATFFFKNLSESNNGTVKESPSRNTIITKLKQVIRNFMKRSDL